MENQVEMLQGSALDDAAQAPVEQEGESLATVLEEQPVQGAPDQAQAAQNEAPPVKEPGWIKQRIEKAVKKATLEAEERVSARYEAILAPIRADVMDREAKELVSSGEFKTLERAKEYVALKHGAPVQQQEASSVQRDARGRFAPQEPEQAQASQEDAVVRARSELLAKQAQKIKTQRGVDVMQAFNSDPQVKQKILSGEWDFYDVAESLSTGRSRVPAPLRSTNGSGVTTVSVADMSAEQFRRLQENLAAGRVYDMRK